MTTDSLTSDLQDKLAKPAKINNKKTEVAKHVGIPLMVIIAE